MKLIGSLDAPSRTLYANAYEGKGIAEIAAGRWDDVIDDLKFAIDIEPKRAHRLNGHLAQAYRRRGEAQGKI